MRRLPTGAPSRRATLWPGGPPAVFDRSVVVQLFRYSIDGAHAECEPHPPRPAGVLTPGQQQAPTGWVAGEIVGGSHRPPQVAEALAGNPRGAFLEPTPALLTALPASPRVMPPGVIRPRRPSLSQRPGNAGIVGVDKGGRGGVGAVGVAVAITGEPVADGVGGAEVIGGRRSHCEADTNRYCAPT